MTDIQATRQKIAGQTQADQNPPTPLDQKAWWLLGTAGCHLCDEAGNTLRLFSSVNPVSVQKVDITELDEALMNEFATLIPVILTPTQQINYPFSVADLMNYKKFL